MPESYIVRFKFVKLECASLKDGQQYIITYHRGDTYRSTPCYFSNDGFVDFSLMPEGAAVVHFKTGGVRFQPKWIKFRVEEYTRGQPRRVVGEAQVDCAEVLGIRGTTASTTRMVTFDLYGLEATMTVALLVCPQGHPTLSFDGLIKTNRAAVREATHAPSTTPESETRKMARGEAMALLVSLEAMLERRIDKIGKTSESPLERQFAELAERRRALTNVEGMAAAAVKHRAEEVPAAQFTALSRKYRENFIGEVAAYLRQMAIDSGVPLSNGQLEDLTLGAQAARERLQRTNARIDSLSQQIRNFEEEKSTLSRLQGRADVPSKTAALHTKIETLQSQLQLLENSRGFLEGVVRGRDNGALPISREIQEIRARTRLLASEEEQLRERIRRMMTVTASHVLKWARGKNPPMEDVRTDLASLFSAEPGVANEQRGQGAKSGEVAAGQWQNEVKVPATSAQQQRSEQKQKPSAPSDSSSSDDGFSKTGQKAPGKDGLPSSEKPTGDKGEKAKPMHRDVYVPDLSSSMFASQNPGTADSATKRNVSTLPVSGKLENSPSNESHLPVFDFSSNAQENDRAPGDLSTMWDNQPGFLGSGAEGNLKASAVQIFSMDGDPMYDFTPTTEAKTGQSYSAHIGDADLYASFGGGGGIRAAMDTSEEATLPEQLYNFGPDKDTDKDLRQKDANSFLPKYNFGGDTGSKNNRGGLPGHTTYNFGS